MTKYVTGLVGKGTTTVDGDDTVLQIWGLSHIVGATVSAFICKGDAGDFTVAADGSITVPLYPTTPSLALTIANFIAVNGFYGESDTPISIISDSVTIFLTIPIVIGAPFVSQGQRLRPATEADIKSPLGAALGKKRRTSQFAVLVQEAVIVNFGTSLTPVPLGNMLYSQFSTVPEQVDTILGVGETFSGVYWGPINDSATYDSEFCWQVDRPWPCTICAISQFLDTGEPN